MTPICTVSSRGKDQWAELKVVPAFKIQSLNVVCQTKVHHLNHFTWSPAQKYIYFLNIMASFRDSITDQNIIVTKVFWFGVLPPSGLFWAELKARRSQDHSPLLGDDCAGHVTMAFMLYRQFFISRLALNRKAENPQMANTMDDCCS